MKITAPILCKLEEKFSLVAAASDVPDMIRQEVAVGARHRLFLEVTF
jgi:hypothetical protein